jgi:Domain of unknown function (DUF6456)
MSNLATQIDKDMRRVLDVLTREGGQAAQSPGGSLELRHTRNGITLGAGEAAVIKGSGLVEAGLATWCQREGEDSERLVATTRGFEVQRDYPEGNLEPSPYLASRLPLKRINIEGPEGTVSVLVNTAESPLAWLRRRKGKDGRTLISETAFVAGERLRRDLTLAGNLPGVTMDWSRPFIDKTGPGGERGLNVTETVIAARQRIAVAMHAVGHDLSGLLIDLCGFLKPLGRIEAEKGWPARSGKVMARMALDRLADHYGLSDTAKGPQSSRGIREWGTADRRPEMSIG